MSVGSRVAAFASSLLFSATLGAQAFPNKVIRIIRGYEVGGGATVGLQLFAEELGRQLGATVIVEPRPGASFSIAARAVKNPASDGHTLYAGGMGSDPLLFKNGVRVLNDLKPVSMVTEIPLVFFTNSAKGLKSIADVVAYAKANPDSLNFASVGGSVYLNLMMSVLAGRLGFSYVNVPYNGAPKALLALMSGEVDVSLLSVRSAQAGLHAGKITPILVGSAKRLSLFPDAPSLEEVGLSNIAVDSKVGLWAPSGTPSEVFRMLSDAAQAVAKDPTLVEKFTSALGAPPFATSPEAMGQKSRAGVPAHAGRNQAVQL